ncbi:unnamed protein product [Clonostachys rhizophaga]|uniref:Uncharacterized protein n=1 Tax=Clonostachys rhizophaga TaxID=160324 RepID=A0A9N9W0T8_9HYPO|nr:unnamed protein product [Clonostachys rhizophaga]
MVTQQSACRIGFQDGRQPLPSDHFSLVKLFSQADPNYRIVQYGLRALVKDGPDVFSKRFQAQVEPSEDEKRHWDDLNKLPSAYLDDFWRAFHGLVERSPNQWIYFIIDSLSLYETLIKGLVANLHEMINQIRSVRHQVVHDQWANQPYRDVPVSAQHNFPDSRANTWRLSSRHRFSTICLQ